MTVRLIDFLCKRHRALVVDGRYWPNGLVVGVGCQDCVEQSPTGTHRFVTLPDIDLRTTLAIHEAGHAVIHTAQGTPIDDAELWAENGVVRVGGDGTQQAHGTLAGASAVRLRAIRHGLTSDADVADAVWTAQHDFQMLYDCGFSYEDVEPLLAPTDAMVAEHWPAIERVADALLSRGRLSGDEIAAIAGIEVAA